MSSVITVAVASVAVGAYSAYEGHKNSQAASRSAQNIENKQNYYNDQLKALMADPGSFFSNPVFTAARDQGLQATERQMAAGGFNMSGNMTSALMQQGQSFAAGQLLSQEQLLADLSGAKQNASEARNSSTAAQGQSFNELAAVMQGVGQVAGLFS